MHVTWGLASGGTESQVVSLANEQAKNAEVCILVVNDLESDALLSEIAAEVKVYRIKRRPGSRNILDQLRIMRSILKEMPDVFHLHHYGLYRFVRFVKLLRRPTFLTVHSANYPCVELDKHRCVFAISEVVRGDLFGKCGIEAKTVYNGIDIDKIRCRKNLRWKGTEPFKIAQIGRLQHKVKGQHVLLFALRKLIDDYQVSNFTVDFIGAGESLEFLQGVSNKLRLEDHCNFLGDRPREEIFHNLADYHLLAQPSLCEGFGLTMAEAMAAKVPVIGSDIGAIREMLFDGDRGKIFNVNDPKDLARKIEHIMSGYNKSQNNNRICRAYMGVAEEFDIKKTSIKYLHQYRV